MLRNLITVQPSYQIKCTKKAVEAIHQLDSEDQRRVETILETISEHEKPTEHSKVKVLNNNQTEKLYKLRIGDFRAVLRLEKPVLQVLRFGPRSSVYDDIERVYDAL